MLTLFYAPGACSLAVHIALEKAGAEFALQRVDLKAGEQYGADFLAVNPRARVPALVAEGHALTEATAILLYLERRYPAAELFPVEAWARGKALEAISWLSSTVHPLYRAYWRTHWFADETHAHPPIRETAARRILEAMTELDAAVAGRAALVGHAPAAADYYALVFARWAFLAFPDAMRLGHLRRYVEALALQPPVSRALAVEGITLFAPAKAA
jgi:glutathione S-transferase